MKLSNRFFVRVFALAAMTGVGASALAASASIGGLCTPCIQLYQYCVSHGGGMGECEDQLDQCRATQCPGTAAVTPFDRKTIKAGERQLLARTTVTSNR